MRLAGKRYLTSNGKAVFIILLKDIVIINGGGVMLCEMDSLYLQCLTLLCAVMMDLNFCNIT